MDSRKKLRDEAVDILCYFEEIALDGSSWTTDMVVEIMRDGYVGFVNMTYEQLLDELKHHRSDPKELQHLSEDELDWHNRLLEAIDRIEAELAIDNILSDQLNR